MTNTIVVLTGEIPGGRCGGGARPARDQDGDVADDEPRAAPGAPAGAAMTTGRAIITASGNFIRGAACSAASRSAGETRPLS